MITTKSGSEAQGRLKSAILVVLAVALFPLAVGNLVRKAIEAPPTDGVGWRPSADGLFARRATGDGAVAAGDRLIAVEGGVVFDQLGLNLMLSRGQAGDSFRYEVERDGVEREVMVELRTAPGARMHAYLASVGLVALIVGLAALRLHGSSATTELLAASSLAFFALMAFSPAGFMDPADKLFFALDELGRLALAPLIVHMTLALVAPEGRRRWALYLPSALLLLGAVGHVVAGPWLAPDLTLVFGQALDRAGLLLLAAGVLGAVAVGLGTRRARASGPARVLLAGAAVGLGPAAVLYALPSALGLSAVADFGRLSVLASVALPISWACAVMGLRPSDLRVIGKRALAWTLTLAGLFGIFVATTAIADSAAIGPERGARGVLGFAALGLSVVAFLPLKRRADRLVRHVFERGLKRDQDLVRAFGRRLTEEIRLGELLESLMEQVTSVVGRRRLALYVRGLTPDSYRLARSRGAAGGQLPPELHFLAPELLAASEGGVVTLRAVAPGIGLGDAGLTHAFPIVARGRLSGLLALEAPAGGLSFEDIELLSALLSYAAVAAENALLYEELNEKITEVRALESFRSDIIESLSVGVVITDLDGVILAANPACAMSLAGAPADLRGHTLDEVLPASVCAPIAEARERQTLFKIRHEPAAASGPDGSGEERVLSVAVMDLRRGGEAYGRIVTLEDVTERIAAQTRSLQQDKLAALGLLAAGIAHEINTPLAGIASYTQLVLEDMQPTDPRFLTLKKVENQCFRAARIVDGLLNFARKSERDGHTHVDLGRVIGETLALLEHEFKRARVKLDCALDPGLKAMNADEGALQQIVLNLVKNALDAMPSGGTLSIVTRAEGERVGFEVSDTGHGMGADVRERIFDPFFTTKRRGQGIGLGLSVTYGLVREQSGTIVVDSAPERGARFRVMFPAASVAELEEPRVGDNVG